MNKHTNDKEDLLKAARAVFTNRYILTERMHRFYAKETFRLYHKKWKNGVLLAGVITLGAGILLATALPGWFKIAGGLIIIAGCYFIFMSFFGYLYGARASYKNLEAQLGTPPEVTVRFYPAFFSVETGSKPLNFYYKQITRRLEYDEMSILIVGNGNSIAHGQIIDKAALSPKDLESYYNVLEHAGILPE
ncbi:MAG: hypothetical protein K5879_01575 [Lachnospiraceae bacterium]|nr:hypothetical protein [Lachnospiraceae bacterium]